jgi:hypothetical protein
VRAPLTFVHGSCVFAAGLDDGWAAFVIEPASYAWLSDDGKRRRMLSMRAALELLQADLQLIRVATAEADGAGDADPCPRATGRHDVLRRRYHEAQRRRLAQLRPRTIAVFVLVSLREPRRDLGSLLARPSDGPGEAWRRSVGDLLLGRRRFISPAELERASVRAEQLHAKLAHFLPARPARGVELQWLVRRGFCRGLGEPAVDGLHEPAALVFERNGRAALAPLEGDVMRWAEGAVRPHARMLEIESELGVSWQAMLAFGALPERAPFPGSRAELMFAPPESLPYGVDLTLNARFIPNELAARVVRRRVQDADQIVRAEADGDQGVSDRGRARALDARELLSRLQAASRPPLLRTSISLAVGADSRELLEERVEAVRRAYGEVALHRPPGDQLRLFIQHLPAQRTRVAGYEDMLTVEQVAAMMPAATHAAGSSRGFHLGHALSGSRRAIRFNLREGSDSDRNAAILCVGSLGSGKTTLVQKLLYEGYLLGARVVDCDPKGDHRFHLLPELAGQVESITLQPDASLRGMLDPLRVAPGPLRQEVAVSFLRDLLPAGCDPGWETAIVKAVDAVIARSPSPGCSEVVRALREGDRVAAAAGAALEVYTRSGLTQLGFADPAVRLPEVGQRQVTYLPIRDLPAPDPGLKRAEYSQSERAGAQIVRLIAMFAMHLMSSERSRLKLFAFDEGWRLLGDPVGRALLGSLQRMGRSELAVPLIATQLLTDALVGEPQSLENLIGATFVFGMRSEREAARALGLLGLDGEDPELRRVLLEMDAGRCLFRDHRGRVEAIQVDVAPPALLAALSTSPSARR